MIFPEFSLIIVNENLNAVQADDIVVDVCTYIIVSSVTSVSFLSLGYCSLKAFGGIEEWEV